MCERRQSNPIHIDRDHNRMLPEMGTKFQYSSPAVCMMVLVVAVAVTSTLVFPTTASHYQLVLYIIYLYSIFLRKRLLKSLWFCSERGCEDNHNTTSAGVDASPPCAALEMASSDCRTCRDDGYHGSFLQSHLCC
jgi:hypothetical protein